MSLISNLIGGSAAQPIEAIGNVFDKLFTSDEERAVASQAMEKLRQHPAELQVEINKIEAAHRSIFVAGWRPAIGWVCALGLAWQFIFQPLNAYLITAMGLHIATPPTLDSNMLYNLVIAMLGMGTLRTVEKLQGRAK